MISNKTINAIELCVLLAGHRGDGYLTTTHLSPRLGLSISYLENILRPLRDCGIVLSMKGPGGGYMIRGDASLISIWDVASVFEKTLFESESNDETSLKKLYELELEQVVMNTLKSFTLADFADFSPAGDKPYTDATSRYKLKPLPLPFIPKAPNSVFQLGMSF